MQDVRKPERILLYSYPKVKTWLEQLMQRESFIKTAPSSEDIEADRLLEQGKQQLDAKDFDAALPNEEH